MPRNPKQNERIESGCDAEEPETKGRESNLSAMSENPNQNKGIESGDDAGEPKIKEWIESGCTAEKPETKGRDRIWARCRRTRIKTKGSNVSKGAKKGLCPSLRYQYHVRNPQLHIKSKSQSLKYYKHSFLRKSPPH